MEKDDINKLLKKGVKKVFISAALKKYGKAGVISGQWFTLKIEPRGEKNVNQEVFLESNDDLLEIGLAPSVYFIPPCPPFWTKNFDPDEDISSIVFSRNNDVSEL